MKNVIFTMCDEKYGDFLTNHWLKSLKENVNLKNIDVVILDYGLTTEQVEKLKVQNVVIEKCKRDGHVTAIRFRDMAVFLRKHKGKYDQVLSLDGGDIIFQEDISNIFEKDKNQFRVACETYNIANFSTIFTNKFFKKDDAEKIKSLLKGKRMINAGVIFAPVNRFIALCDEIYNMMVVKDKFGPDQVAVNYILYREGFKELDEKYNFVIATSKSKFFIKDGIFYKKNREKIAIVHNTGYKTVLRPIKNFGYGKEFNETKKQYLIFLRTISRIRKKHTNF